MKTMKKKKLAVIGIAGVAGLLYSGVPASAQTFYQCMPITCPAGKYLENGKCNKCPSGTYNNKSGQVGSESCIKCPSGTGSWNGASKCEAPSCLKIYGVNNSNNFSSNYKEICLNQTVNCTCDFISNLFNGHSCDSQSHSYFSRGAIKCSNGYHDFFTGKRKAVCENQNNCLSLKIIND